jgi:SAM-dependent methyltransferase
MPVLPAPFFDAMAARYDELEPWYEHLYAVLHEILRGALRPATGPRRPRALDAGCGTGLQTAVLAELGYEAHGMDLSAGLLEVARRKPAPGALTRGDLHALPYAAGVFDAATCCGSTLSFVDDAGRALAELSRVLRPGGLLLVECEGRWTPDLGWAWLSGLAGDPLGYGLRPGQVWRAATTPPARECRLEYPGYGPLRLFTIGELARLLRAAGCAPLRTWGIHSVTNLLPSTVLHRQRLGRGTAAVYAVLRAADRAVAGLRGAARVANSLVVLARKDA